MPRQLLIFTDLDGTLLDHASYSWRPARRALQQLTKLKVPLIFNSSKTATEIVALRAELHNAHPYVVENGGAIIVPAGTFSAQSPETVQHFGRDYHGIRSVLEQLRHEQGYRFAGFADLGLEGVMAATDLDEAEARKALTRQSSEPLLWEGDEAELEHFSKNLTDFDLQLVKGGRFYHVMGPGDKGTALNWLTDRYRQAAPDTQFTSVALGDGPNDLPMLEKADIAVVIKPHRGAPLQLPNHPQALYPAAPGPTGWQQALDQILNSEL